MKLFTSLGRKRAAAIAVTVLAAASLAACGGDGDDYRAPDAPTPAPTPTPTPVPAIDAFFAAVSALIGTASPEDAEPSAAVESLVATTPENTEPQPI
ncbi:hypothetical protein CR105_23030 [Massilia eurypsychrophila]|jgi:hypothetical protein|uniref:Lipoprotein n=1 Tax=Massilia eurypsychrophila TaxID=1485217 RepID=A0A2G8T9K4_9BURK|nr:hypothetical protein [Massilia eurypsychrophila]PIL42720.1 hypothetical protein CR105_23030 [Massilia eurypsychrophila]